MRVLFATGRHDDYISACCWSGFQDLLGEANVVDAGATPSLHDWGHGGGASWRVAGNAPGPCLNHGERDFDLLVLHSCLLSDRNYDWPIELRTLLRPGGKTVWIEGGDGWNEVNVPPFAVDAVLRREIHPTFAYPYAVPVHHFGFAAPERWLERSDNASRTYDVFASFSWQPNPARKACLEKMWQTQCNHTSIGASGAVAYDRYFDYLRSSKLALCPPGGADSDCMRFAEVAACGAIPVFVGLPPKIREEWFTHGENAFFCELADLPALLDAALGMDLHAMRTRLLDHVRAQHTTRRRAEKILRVVGLA